MTTQNGGQTDATAPGLGILGQYVKDLSFENPNAPQSLMMQPEQPPAVDVQINVNAKPMAEPDYEVELKIEVRAEDKKAKRVLFNLELAYAGVFRITNVPKENIQPLLLIECPRLLFPFVRDHVAAGRFRFAVPRPRGKCGRGQILKTYLKTYLAAGSVFSSR